MHFGTRWLAEKNTKTSALENVTISIGMRTSKLHVKMHVLFSELAFYMYKFENKIWRLPARKGPFLKYLVLVVTLYCVIYFAAVSKHTYAGKTATHVRHFSRFTTLAQPCFASKLKIVKLPYYFAHVWRLLQILFWNITNGGDRWTLDGNVPETQEMQCRCRRSVHSEEISRDFLKI